MSKVQRTSREALKSIDVETRRQQVLDIFTRNPYYHFTDHELSRILKWPINCVTGRRFELVRMGKIREYGSRIDPETKHRCITWKLKT